MNYSYSTPLLTFSYILGYTCSCTLTSVVPVTSGFPIPSIVPVTLCCFDMHCHFCAHYFLIKKIKIKKRPKILECTTIFGLLHNSYTQAYYPGSITLMLYPLKSIWQKHCFNVEACNANFKILNRRIHVKRTLLV